MAAGAAWSWVSDRVDGVAARPTGVQSRAIIVKGISIVLPLTLVVAVRTTLIVPA